MKHDETALNRSTKALRQRRVGLARVTALLACMVTGAFCTPAFGDSAGISNVSTLTATTGQQVYTQLCQGCHMPNGQGAVGAGHYPAFAHDPVLASAPYMALTILGGRRGMPAFALKPGGDAESESFIAPIGLTDAQIAGVINYIRTHFGNDYKDTISAAEVKALHP